jgi:translation initiation factor 5A
MSIRKIPAGNLKKGSYFLEENGAVCNVLDIQHSKSGKHGHAKNRVSCVGLFDKKKRSIVFSSGAMVDVPEIIKSTGQITDITDSAVIIMDLESFETFEADYPIDEIPLRKINELKENPDSIGESQAEYWDVMGKKLVTRILK